MASANASAQLRAISAKLKEAGDGRLIMNQLRRDIRVAAGPLKSAVRASALAKLPKGGGLNQQVANQRVTISVLSSARSAGVRLRTTAPDTAMTNAGFVRHPLPGNNRSKWVTQQIPQAAGWWTDPLQRLSPTITPVVLGVMRKVAAEIESG